MPQLNSEPRSVHEFLECSRTLQEYCTTYYPQSEPMSRDQSVIPNIFPRLNYTVGAKKMEPKMMSQTNLTNVEHIPCSERSNINAGATDKRIHVAGNRKVEFAFQ